MLFFQAIIDKTKNFILQKKQLKNLKKKMNPKTMLHLGCGRNYFNDWINIDNNSYNDIQKLDLHWDVRKKLPFKDNSVDFIYNEHFFEHLSIEESLSVLNDFKRILKPNGVIRISMPDLDEIVQIYLNPHYKPEDFSAVMGTELLTKAEFLNVYFRWWGHQWLYNWEELERRLKAAGFSKIKKCKIGISEYPELNNIEQRTDSRLIAEVSK
ncbi:MAG: methyltransferase domain-containing protein [Endomicrobiia bacterium]|jgi:predicted SAM-dependent methyltransferase|nr:methyltransferase domain-containing protein [Endomicrobiaceae bacterium]MDD3053886.1 methyltransferase domain-containing protein [Endomicrobiaceae bacterium]MDD3922974.1 methyltransferase domain-containing protein [Endomicrobiaceae bacterium]MDD5102474.1 methyltransferase domain-containing protein [Endomicrobiaceae bacterium]